MYETIFGFFLILIHDIKDALNNVRDTWYIFHFLKNKKALKNCTPDKNYKQFINFSQKCIDDFVLLSFRPLMLLVKSRTNPQRLWSRGKYPSLVSKSPSIIRY